MVPATRGFTEGSGVGHGAVLSGLLTVPSRKEVKDAQHRARREEHFWPRVDVWLTHRTAEIFHNHQRIAGHIRRFAVLG
jgi:hypothetical protein